MPPKGTKSAPITPPKRAAQLSPPSEQDATHAREVVEAIKKHLQLDRPFRFFESEAEVLRLAAKTPRSNCILDNRKLLATGIPMSAVRDAVASSLKAWKRDS